jgi:hypothetical protein
LACPKFSLIAPSQKAWVAFKTTTSLFLVITLFLITSLQNFTTTPVLGSTPTLTQPLNTSQTSRTTYLNMVQQSRIVASDAHGGDMFGRQVALSRDGGTSMVSAYGQNSFTGAVYTFWRFTGTWVQQSEITLIGGLPGDYFGGAIALSSDGNTALIGAYGQNSFTGAAYLFKRTNTGVWSQVARLVAPDGAEGDYFGKAVAISGDGNTTLVGAYANNAKRGAAYLFRYTNNTWGTAQKLTANDAATNDELGMAVALDDNGNTALVGAFGKTAGGGTAYLFTLY